MTNHSAIKGSQNVFVILLIPSTDRLHAKDVLKKINILFTISSVEGATNFKSNPMLLKHHHARRVGQFPSERF